MSLPGAPRFETTPTLVSLGFGQNSLHQMCHTFAQDRPQDFLAYLNQAWKTQGPLVLRNPRILTDLKNTNVLCEDGKMYPLGKTYLPLPKLKYLQSRYMLSDETFPFLQMSPESVTDNDLGEWAFLKNDIGVGVENDAMFFVSMLICVKRYNPTNVRYPRRLLELYLRIHAAHNASDAAAQNQQQLRQVFRAGAGLDVFEKEELIHATSGRWLKPEECVLRSTFGLASKTALVPVPGDWEASKHEVAELKDFYFSTIGIPKVTYLVLLNQLDFLRETKSIGSTSKVRFARDFYRALDEMRKREQSPEFDQKLRSEFADHPRIAIISGDILTWVTSTASIWAPHLICPELNNLSTQYSELRSFWVDLLDVKGTNFGSFYHELLSLPPGEPSIERAKSLIMALDDEIVTYGDLVDREKLLQSAVFPVRQANGEVKLHSIESPFVIADKQYLREAFALRLDLLDFDPTTIWQIENFLVWADLEPRYLSWNVEEKIACKNTELADAVTSDLILSIAEGLVRIAVHFQSPRATNPSAQEALLYTLQRARVSLGRDMKSTLIYSKNEKCVKVDSSLLGASIQGSDQIVIYLPYAPHKLRVCWATSLPKRLVEWLMTDPETEFAESVDERAVSLVKSILMPFQENRSTFAKDILDAEGIVDIEALKASQYALPANVPILEEGPSAPLTTSQVDAPSPGPKRHILTPRRSRGRSMTPESVANAVGSLKISDAKK